MQDLERLRKELKAEMQNKGSPTLQIDTFALKGYEIFEVIDRVIEKVLDEQKTD